MCWPADVVSVTYDDGRTHENQEAEYHEQLCSSSSSPPFF